MCENMARIYDLRGTSEENVKEDLIRPKNVQKTSSNMRRIIQESIITNKMQGNKSMGDMPGNLLRKIDCFCNY